MNVSTGRENGSPTYFCLKYSKELNSAATLYLARQYRSSGTQEAAQEGKGARTDDSRTGRRM